MRISKNRAKTDRVSLIFVLAVIPPGPMIASPVGLAEVGFRQ